MTPRFISQKVSSDYIKLVIAVTLIVTILSFAFAAILHKNNKVTLENSIEQRALHLDSSLSESFNYIIYLMDFLGKQISTNGADLKYIQSLYSGFRGDLKVKNLSSWSMFDWLTPDKMIRITSAHGILKTPVNLAERENLKEAYANPDKVFFNHPDMGKISKQLIIPISKAVANKNGKRLGFINIGVSIPALLLHLENYNDGITYALFTDKFLQITDKQEQKIDNNSLESFKKEVKFSSGLLDKPIIAGNKKYTYYYKSSEYPFIFLLGYNPAIQNNLFIKSLILPVTIFLILGFIGVFLSYLLYCRVILPISILGQAAQNIAEGKDINLNLKTGLPLEITNLSKQLDNINVYKKQLLEAKHAVETANAAKTEFLYYLTGKDGKMYYAKTFEEHKRNRERFLD